MKTTKRAVKKSIKPTSSSVMTSAIRAHLTVLLLNIFVFAGGESDFVFTLLLVSSVYLTIKTYLANVYFDRMMFLHLS